MMNFEKFKLKNVFIKKMLADGITDKGEKLVKYLGMKNVCYINHNSKIYELILS